MQRTSLHKGTVGLLAIAGVLTWRGCHDRDPAHQAVARGGARSLPAWSSPPPPTAAPELVAPTPPGVPGPGLPAWSQPAGPSVAPAPATTVPPPLTEAERDLLTQGSRRGDDER